MCGCLSSAFEFLFQPRNKMNFLLAETEEAVAEAKSLRVENKMFYFDVGHNRRGTYMRISEVRWLNDSIRLTV